MGFRIRVLVLVAAVLALIAAPAHAVRPHGLPSGGDAFAAKGHEEPGEEEPGEEEEGGETEDILRANAEYAAARTAPGFQVSAGAFRAALAQAEALPVFGGTWRELTTKPYLNDDPKYADPFWSNYGAGWGFVTGRITSLVAQGRTVYAGAAGGGVWKSTNGGTNWTPLLDDAPSLSIGSLALDPADGSLWVGTGEANTNSDSYVGTGVLRSADGGRTFQPVGGTQLDDHLIGRIVFDGEGAVYAATSRGLYKRDASDLTGRWTLVLKPGTDQFGTTWVNDVDVRPGTGGKGVLANVAFGRGGAAYDGLYYSGNRGKPGTWSKVEAFGDPDFADIGRSTLEWTADGSKLYAVIGDAPEAAIQGVYVSPEGSPTGPYEEIASPDELLESGSNVPYETVGVQGWYNQFLGVDPADPDHIWVGLEEVFESRDGGATFTTPGPYWNYGLPCGDECPMTTHPDQHAIAFSGDRVYIGNDGGVYSRSKDGPARGGWTNHNRRLRTLQYYAAGVGKIRGGVAIWGGLQDNGESLLRTGDSLMYSPFGGDGGDTLVDPANGDRAVVEYTNLDMNITTNGGRSDGSTFTWREATPSCFAFLSTPDPCEPAGRFIAPFRGDVQDYANHWIAGGRYLWETRKGFDTVCDAESCDWTPIHDLGAGHATTAIAVRGDVVYAGWCGGTSSCAGPASFESGIDTNYGGAWHRVSSPVLPNRFVAAVTVDPADPAHVYAVYNGFSRRWVKGAGTGHVFESTNGGGTWTDISGNLPDAPGDDLLITGGRLTLATDVGVFTAPAGQGAGTSWAVLGKRFPHGAPANDLTLWPDGRRILAATHGRGLWDIATP